jgi:hypothetical protein
MTLTTLDLRKYFLVLTYKVCDDTVLFPYVEDLMRLYNRKDDDVHAFRQELLDLGCVIEEYHAPGAPCAPYLAKVSNLLPLDYVVRRARKWILYKHGRSPDAPLDHV